MVYAVVGILVAMDLLVVWALLGAFRANHWEPLERAFPAVEPLPGAVRRNFQSFSFGMFNMGWCVHVAVDDCGLHLTPARPLRWVRCGSVSIPWERVEVVCSPRGRWGWARAGGQDFKGPAWCLELAGPAKGPGTG